MTVDPNLFKKQLKWGGVIALIFYLDSSIENNIASKHVRYVDGCVVRATTREEPHKVAAVTLKTESGEKLVLVTRNYSKIYDLNNYIGKCFHFSFYKHSFLIPDIGRSWMIDYQML